jgi:hypothetical protein
VAGLVLATALGTLTACGGEESTLPGPDVTSAPPPPTSTAVIPPTAYAGGFSAVAKAADGAPALAQSLAAEVVQAANVRGEPNSPAATLRAKLTHRLVLHVHLVGLVAVSVLDTGPDSERTAAALKAVDANSVALAKLIPKGDKAAEPRAKPTADEDEDEDEDKVADVARRSPDFLTAWRTHVDDLAAYALAAREGIDPDMDDARRDMDTWRAAAASSLKDAAAGRARSSTLRNNLGGYTKAITRAMNGFAEKTVAGPEQLRKAASAMTDFANTLGQGLAKAGDLEGDANDNAAGIRAEFTRLVTENIAMTSATAVASYTNRRAGGAASPPAQIAKLGLDENSKDLAERLRPAAGPRERVEFLQLWRTAVNDFLDYTEAVRTDNQKRADAEVKALNTQRKELSEFVAGLGNGKGASALSAALRTHIANLTGAIQGLKAELDPS